MTCVLTRRLGGTLLAALMMSATAACADDEAPIPPAVPASPSGSASPSAVGAGEVEPGAYPVTIDHRYGSTTVEAEPKRVVAVGLTDIDPLLALDVVPVGFIDWYEDAQYPEGIWPWAQDAFGDADPDLMPRNGDKFLFERIAALRPDLIIGQYTGITDEDYKLLSAIAPTVAQSAEHEDYTTPWQDMTRVIGQAVGRPAAADRLISDVDAAFARARAEYPQFDGSAAIFAERFEQGQSYPRGSSEPRVRFLSELGFVIPPQIGALAGESGANLSDERMDLLNTADVLVWNLYEDKWREELRTNEIYQRLDVAAEGRDVFVQGLLGGALTWSSVLSLPFAIERLAPLFAAALDGDPTTSATPTPVTE